MPKYKVEMIYPNGSTWVEDPVFDTEEEADAYGCDAVSCFRLGNEIIAMSNPWEEREDGEADFEVIEIDD